MVSQYGIKFAVHLITNHFGNLVAKVCETLLQKGPLTLGELIRYTELNHIQIKNSLLVLVQHNCVQAFISVDEFGHQDESKVNTLVTTQYLALFDNILHRLRFPKFLEIVSRELDDECVELLDGLLRDGRLTLKQMADRANQGRENPVAPDALHGTLCKLLKARYVERCPAAEPVVSALVQEGSTRKRGAKSAKIFEAAETIEQHILEATVPGDAIRFSITADTECETDRETNSEVSSMISGGENAVQEDLILWRANFEEFIRHLRHKALIENERKRLDEGAATVLSAILEATRTGEKKVKIERSAPLTLDAIFTEVVKTENGRTMTKDRVRASLVQLGCEDSMLEYDAYSIDLKKIIEWARNEEVESIVLKRHGRNACRMFRFLSNDKDNCFFETDKIADTLLVGKKEAPKLLYKLWKDNYLQMEKSHMPATKQSKFSLWWKVNKTMLREYVLEEMHHAALNLSLRMAFEQEKDAELLNVPKDKFKEPGPLQKKYKRLLNVWLLMGSSLMKLDDALMLFHDF